MRLLVALLFWFTAIGGYAASETPATQQIKAAFLAGDLKGLHGVYAKQDGQVIAEAYFAGHDQIWGAPTGARAHGPDRLHDLRSISKNVVGLLYGIALDEGIVQPVDASLFAQFPEYSDLSIQQGATDIRIKHALTMTLGLEWDETIPYTDPRNSEIAMEMAPDRYRYILSQPVISQPGEKWVYSGGAAALVGKLIEKGAGIPINEYAEQRLFTPLGITKFDWVGGADKAPSAASGLRLTLVDMVKLGELIVADGRWGEQQIVSADWIDEMLTPQAQPGGALGYGYFWWVAPEGGSSNWAAGFGNGGQRLSMNRQDKVVVGVFAGNYNWLKDWEMPLKIVTDFIAPAISQSK
ncbi:MAG: serine hydrolase domain-containing protein [Pikeienuella sp.]